METIKGNTPVLRFPEFFGDWEHVTLGEVSKDIAYGMNSAAIEFDGKHKYLRITDIDENTRAFTPSPLSSPDGIISEKYRLKNGDMVFARTGASVGKSYLYKEKDGELYYAGFLIKFSISKAVPYFVYSQTFRGEYNKWVLKMSMRSGQPGINAEEYKTLKISYPPKPEQQKIASFLTTVDNKLQQLQKKKQLLEQYKKGLMQQFFTQQLRFKDDEGNEYAEWEERTLGEMITIKSGDSPTKHNLKPKGVFPYLKVEDLNNCNKYQSTSREYSDIGISVVEKMSVIFPKRGAAIMTNKVRINKVPIQMDSNLMSITPNRAILNYEFLYYKMFHEKLYKIADTSSIPQINNKHILPYKIQIPKMAEQKSIANFLSGLDAKIDLVQTEIEQTQNYKKGLLQQMFV